MRVVLDTNILVSALVQPKGRSAGLVEAWDDGRFELLYCDDQLAEFRRVTRSGKLKSLLSRTLAGGLLNAVKLYGTFVADLPEIDHSPDPWDNFLLAMAQKGKADFLVTGDKTGLLQLGAFGATRIVSVRQFAAILGL